MEVILEHHQAGLKQVSLLDDFLVINSYLVHWGSHATCESVTCSSNQRT